MILLANRALGKRPGLSGMPTLVAQLEDANGFELRQ